MTLEAIVTALVAHFGWNDLGDRVAIRCFQVDPSVPSSLKFLRRTPWARAKVESLYLFMLREQARAARRAAQVPAGVGATAPTAAPIEANRPVDGPERTAADDDG